MNKLSVDYGGFRSADGLEIFYRKYKADPEKARMIISHGLGEHSGRYENVVERMLPLGISVWVPDHRGHGQSGGRNGHISSFSQYVEDLRNLVEIARDGIAEDVKVFLLGHSLGGLIALRFTACSPEMLDGMIISSPALGVTVEVPAVKALLGRVMSNLWPTLSLANGLDASKLSHDEEVVRAYIEDPLVHDQVSARWFTEFFTAIEAAERSAPDIKSPMLMQLAGDDHLTNVDTSEKFYEAIGSNDKTLYVYKDLYHEIYNETAEQKKKVLDDLDTWLLKHL
ncbi:MAG: alpha/beta hydrolase [Thermodesulfobacteriota bacterium]|nr:alpha/beta hydrolase [Thermodesulfobacteriota bacterium]